MRFRGQAVKVLASHLVPTALSSKPAASCRELELAACEWVTTQGDVSCAQQEQGSPLWLVGGRVLVVLKSLLWVEPKVPEKEQGVDAPA